MTAAEDRWLGPSADHLNWAEFDDEFFVHHARSGQTHILNAPAALILRELGTRAMSLGELVAVVCEQAEVNRTDELHAQVLAHLKQLQQLGLVRHA
ncbi:MAG: HPr-rel-A system PqqD family peptide chaperone [Chromatiales bacterium]|nr:HPr-rel-A system PqqD family peptide chaperone [Chromatiales bacterium]